MRARALACLAALCVAAWVGPLRAETAQGSETAAPKATSYLGVYTQSNSNVLEASNVYAGITVTRVVENSPAEAGGLRVGDILLEANGVELEAPGRLDDLVEALPPGSALALRLERDGRVLERELRTVARVETPDDADPGGDAAADRPIRIERRRLGFELRAADPERLRALGLSERFGVEVVRLAEQSPLRAVGVSPGDVITEVGRRPVPSPQELIDFVEGLETQRELELTLWTTAGDRRQVDVELYRPGRSLRSFRLFPLVSIERGRDVSEYSFLLGALRWTRFSNGSRMRLLWLLRIETGSPEELIDVGTGG